MFSWRLKLVHIIKHWYGIIGRWNKLGTLIILQL